MPIFATVLTSIVFYFFCLGFSKKKKKVVVKANTCLSSEEEPAFAPKNLTTFFHANCPTRVRARLISTAGISSGVSVTLNKQNKTKQKSSSSSKYTNIPHHGRWNSQTSCLLRSKFGGFHAQSSYWPDNPSQLGYNFAGLHWAFRTVCR